MTPERIAELERLVPIAKLIDDWSDDRWRRLGYPSENTRDLAAYEALRALPELLAEVRVPDGPDFELLRKFANGKAGRRTGALMRAGYLQVIVTPAGWDALEAHDWDLAIDSAKAKP